MNARVLQKPVEWDELYPGRFIKTGDLKGKNVTLTIASVDLRRTRRRDRQEMKGVIAFRAHREAARAQ
jgi:hypothetical protein